jgi:hypothetical protein
MKTRSKIKTTTGYIFLGFAIVCFCRVVFAIEGTTSPTNSPATSPTTSLSYSDQYCDYLQGLHVRAAKENKEPSTLDNLIQFVNSLMQKISLASLEKEAITKRMSFEEFQLWANQHPSTKVNDHYKPKYLESYIREVCGEITSSATFGQSQVPEMGMTAEKSFDPSLHPYYDAFKKDLSTERK